VAAAKNISWRPPNSCYNVLQPTFLQSQDAIPKRSSININRTMAAAYTHSLPARQYALSLSEDEVAQYCKSREDSYCRDPSDSFVPSFAYPPDNPLIFVKWGGAATQAEGDMQKLAFDWLAQERERTKCNIYIPEVYKIFEHDRRAFLLMQFVKATPIRWLLRDSIPYWLEHESECHDVMAEGIQLLSRMPVPSDVRVGRHTSVRTRIRHPIFKDHIAPLIYRDVQEMEDHFNRV
jgi:hypothetical protein